VKKEGLSFKGSGFRKQLNENSQFLSPSVSPSLLSIDEKKSRLDALRPLNNEQLNNLKKLYDVDLTYNSNAIEGSTLTYSETKLILNEGLTIGGKKINEHLEAINHKEAIDFIESLSNASTNDIKLKEILDIHYLILKGINTSEAGKFRTREVGVRKSDGEIYHFTNPLKVQEQMEQFVIWLQTQSQIHPVVLATLTHYKFVSIHPFIDGNGRTARLLMNLVLLQNGYPQAVIKVVNRAEYILAIEKAQSENSLDDFYFVIANAVGESLDAYLQILSEDIKVI
jgi:Fic family protein